MVRLCDWRHRAELCSHGTAPVVPTPQPSGFSTLRFSCNRPVCAVYRHECEWRLVSGLCFPCNWVCGSPGIGGSHPHPVSATGIFGGGLIALGAFLPVMELLMKNTFHPRFVGWSWYPLVALGGALIFLALCRPPEKLRSENCSSNTVS